MPKEKVSYWTKRRRLQQAVSQHIQMIESLQSSHGHNTDQNDEQGSLIHAAGVGASNACSSSDISNTPCNISVPDSSMRWQEESGESSENELNTCMGTSERVGNVSESDLSCEEDSDLGIAGNIAAWAVDFDISHAALNSLLATLQEYHPNLPNDSRTLLKTIRTVSTQNLAGGSYYHFGLQNGMVSKLQLCNPGSNLTVQINIDGLPLFKSSSLQLWPILGLLDQAEDKEPFVIGLFCGKTKPDSCESFLQPLIEELKLIETDGILHNGKSYSVKVSAVICDAPARSFVKCVKGHSGYHGCERCIQEGEYVGKMTFPETEAALRTDKSFKDRRDEDHHLATSPFENTSVGMVTQFPLDYMHLVCLGVVKRMLLLWKKGPFQVRQSNQVLTSVSKTLINMRNLIPMEFSRKTRSVEEVGRWKATEFRTFLLYTGPVVLNGRFPEVLFKNFLLLSIGIRILLSPSLSSVYVGYAHELLVLFVNHWGELYGKDQLVYNVHCLVHLADDVKRYGPLDRVSAFPFENFLGKLKRMVRKPEHPLQQIVRRLSEKDGAVSKEEKILWKSHANGPLPLHFGVCEQFSYATVNGFTVGIREGDNVVKISDDICIVHNIILKDSQKYVLYKVYQQKQSFFDYPFDSQKLDIFVVSDTSVCLNTAPLSAVTMKFVLLIDRDMNIVFPLIH